MAIFLRETHDSRELHYGAQGGGETLRFFAWATAGETSADVYVFTQTNTPLTFDGFIRNDIRVPPTGGPTWKVEVEYGTTGVGGGDQPTGVTPTNPTAPANDTTPLTGGFSFSVAFGQVHITQSIFTASATRRTGYGVAEDYKGAIGVGADDEIAGCDIPPSPANTFQRTVARATVDFAYYRSLRNLCGKTNDADFYEHSAGEVLYIGADGNFTQGEGWSITHKFGTEENRVNIDICTGLIVPAKKGFEYLWVAYAKIDGPNGKTIMTPVQANVEQVLRSGNFAIIEIGA